MKMFLLFALGVVHVARGDDDNISQLLVLGVVHVARGTIGDDENVSFICSGSGTRG